MIVRTPTYNALTDEDTKRLVRNVSILCARDTEERTVMWEIFAKLPKEDLAALEAPLDALNKPFVEAQWRQDDSLTVLLSVYEKLKAARERWCTKMVEDPADMYCEVPDLISSCFVLMHAALKDKLPAPPAASSPTPNPTGYDPPGFGAK